MEITYNNNSTLFMSSSKLKGGAVITMSYLLFTIPNTALLINLILKGTLKLFLFPQKILNTKFNREIL